MKQTIKQQIMKTKTHIPALFLIISLMFASSTFALNKSIDFEEETYIDDIPFNTAEIVALYNYTVSVSISFELEEESYINDIPFNTNWVADEANARLVQFEEESFINDIPFNTKWIAGEASARNFQFEVETYVDDIPFNTYAIASESSKLDGVNIVAINK